MSGSGRGLLVVVPAWNEAQSIAAVLAEVARTVPEADVLVVNDGSTDATADLVRASGLAMLLDLPLNLGVGGAMRAGYRFAAQHGYQYAVQLDADGQHDPAELWRLRELLESGADLVIGARFAGEGTYLVRGPRRWAMRLLAAVLSHAAHTELTDVTSGFRGCSRRAIELFARNYPAEYLGDTVESTVIAIRAGLAVTQVGVQMRPRQGGTPSHNPAKAALFLGRVMLALAVALSRPAVRPPKAVTQS